MRKTLLALAAALAIAPAMSLLPNQAQALPLSAPAGLQAATADDEGLVQQSRYYARKWRHGGYWAPRYHSYRYYRPHRYYLPYSYHSRPYYRSRWYW